MEQSMTQRYMHVSPAAIEGADWAAGSVQARAQVWRRLPRFQGTRLAAFLVASCQQHRGQPSGPPFEGCPEARFSAHCGGRTVVVHGALTEDTQTFRANVIRPAGARFRMSAACTAGLVTADWIAGFPTATLSRMTFSPAAAAI